MDSANQAGRHLTIRTTTRAMCKDVGARLQATIVLNHPVQKQLALDLDVISISGYVSDCTTGCYCIALAGLLGQPHLISFCILHCYRLLSLPTRCLSTGIETAMSEGVWCRWIPYAGAGSHLQALHPKHTTSPSPTTQVLAPPLAGVIAPSMPPQSPW